MKLYIDKNKNHKNKINFVCGCLNRSQNKIRITYQVSIGLKLKENKIITRRINKYIEMEKKKKKKNLVPLRIRPC